MAVSLRFLYGCADDAKEQAEQYLILMGNQNDNEQNSSKETPILNLCNADAFIG